MDNLTISAASGMRARLESLEMLANNLANAATGGYKNDRESYSLYLSAEAAASADGSPATLPVVERHWTDFSAGTLRPTGNPLDLALAGRGFFAVNGPSGTLYTRNGSFQVSSSGVLVAAEGYPVRAVGGGTLELRAGVPVEVDSEGVLRQQGQEVGRLEIADFADLSRLNKQGNTYFRPAGEAAAAAATGTEVHQGKLEDSNVPGAEAAVRLVSIMRQFEMLQRAVALSGEMNRKAVEEVARPGA